MLIDLSSKKTDHLAIYLIGINLERKFGPIKRIAHLYESGILLYIASDNTKDNCLTNWRPLNQVIMGKSIMRTAQETFP